MREKSEVTRAENVRKRRVRENAQSLRRAAVEAERPLQSMVTRLTPTDAVKPKRRYTRSGTGGTRRRFQVALPLPNNDFRTLSIPRPRLGWRSLSFISAALLGLVIYAAFTRPELRVVQAEVTGNQLLAPSEINSVLNVTGRPIFMLIPSELETRLRLHYPELVSVKVDVSLPNLVSVKIVERRPIIRWEQAGGYTWISEDGIAFRPRGEVLGLISVVALSGPTLEENVAFDPLTPAPFISSEMVLSLQGLANHVPPGVPILYDAGLGFGWNDPRGWRVYFGVSASDVELKMRVYESLADSLTQRGIRPALINVTYPTAPYYRMSQ